MSIENDTLKTKIELKKFSQEEMNCKWEKIQLCLNKIPSRSYYTDPRADYPLLEELEIPEEDKEVLKQCLIKLQFSLTYGYQNLWTLYREYLDLPYLNFHYYKMMGLYHRHFQDIHIRMQSNLVQ